MDILITGGCGFIGTNLVLDRLSRGDRVRVVDDCSRAGVERNRDYLQGRTGVDIVEGDVRDERLMASLAADADVIFHLAAQVAVTDSVSDPRRDFEVNALGTLNVLEGARFAKKRPAVLYASTNKVYGGLEDLTATNSERRYELPELPNGVPETRSLDFHSPYGCSKGAADQYVIDYARIYALPTVVFRQSCIYGPWQYGNADQGWLVHFLMRAQAGATITLYGDGLQVRDVLYISDLLELYDLALSRMPEIAGRAYNVGGGPGHTTSLLEFIELIEELTGSRVGVEFAPWRPGDQRVYVSDVRRAAADLDWNPHTPLRDAAREVMDWLQADANRPHPVEDVA